MTSTAPVLELRGASRRYGDGARESVLALGPTSLALSPGECLTVQGPSGAGKSTLLALACGLLLPTEGEVWFRGEPFSRWREPFRARARRAHMAVVVQQLALVHGASALENVLLARVPDGLASAADRQRARDALAELGLAGLEGAPVETLSGGERQRVALARALCQRDPALLVLDEPTAHLDEARAARVLAMIRAALDRGAACLLATHDPRATSLGQPMRLSPPSERAAP